ncbi:hypothetical protein F5Y15DRAFT_102744 [Xylariaceae sp. FL0016]|nr:hypothetical protein F5Y15DRAFT_102744 [Xylariaceae sp. FL0016]
MNSSSTPIHSHHRLSASASSSANPSAGHDDPTYKTALRGATLAFQNTGPKSNPKSVPAAPALTARDNGALIAATSASREHSLSGSPSRSQTPTSRLSLSRQNTGSSVHGSSHGYSHSIDQAAINQRLAQYGYATPHGQSHLMPPGGKHTTADPRSPSFIAATLAASRSGSPSPNPRPQLHPYAQQAARRRRKGSVSANSAASSVTSLDLATDSSPLPSTNALISMFEKKDDNMDPVKKDAMSPGKSRRPGQKPKLRALTPPRALSPVAKNDATPSEPAGPLSPEKAAPPPHLGSDLTQVRCQKSPTIRAKKRPPTPPLARAKTNADVAIHTPSSLSRSAKPQAISPQPQSMALTDTVILSPQPRRATPQGILSDGTGEELIKVRSRKPPARPKPQLPVSFHGSSQATLSVKTSPRSPVRTDQRPHSSSSNDTFVSASSAPSTPAESPRRGRSRPPSPETAHLARPASTQTVSSFTKSRAGLMPQRQQVSNIPLNSLTSAMVAGSLASARATPTSTAPPPPPPRKATPHMRQTLRKQAKSDDEEARARSRHRKKPLGKLGQGKKHFHHEGARKRWREQITLRERKRYEGVWASNRGLLLSGGQMDQMVANVVVRDVWARSRLPFDELAEVWNLVDNQGLGVLDQTEFVVGMWLIDQRLRGRKIPRKVSESVWGSAKGLSVKGPKFKK